MIERIDSILDIPKIQGEIDALAGGLSTSKAGLVDLFKTIQSYKGGEIKNLAADTDKLSTSMTEAAAASAKAVQSNRAIIESAKAQSTAILGGSDSYAFFANSVQEVIRQQLKLKVQLEINKDQIKQNADAFKAGKLTIDQYKDTEIELVEAQKRMRLENQELNKSINLQIKQNNTVGGSLEDLRNQYNALYDVFKKLTDVERQSDFGQQLSADLGNLKVNINEIQKSAGNFSDNVGRYAGSFKEAFGVLEQELVKVRGELANMNPKSAGFDDLAKQEKLLTQLTDGLNKEFTNQTTEIRALQKAAETLGIELGNQNKTFSQFKDKVGEGVDAISDIRAQIKLAGSDTRALDGLIGVAEGLAGAYGVAQGAAALFGEENEELQKTFVKLQAVMTILQGLQSVRNALQAESAAMDAIMTVRTKALAAAQAIYTIAIGTSTGALRILRIAMAATGIGLLIASVVFLASKMDLFGDSVEDATKKLEDEKAAADNLVDSLDKVSAASEKARRSQAGGIDQTKRELDLLKSRGATSIEIFNKEQELRNKELSDLKVLALTYAGTYETRKKNGNLTAADAEALSSKINDINVQGLNKANEIEAAKLAFQKEQNEKSAKNAEEASKKRLDFLSKEAKAAYEIARMRLQAESDLANELQGDDQKMYAERILNLMKFEQMQEQLIIGERDFILATEKLTPKEREKVRVEAELKLNEVTRNGLKSRRSIIEKEKELEKAAYDEMTAAIMPKPGELEARAELITKNVQDIFSKIDFSNDKQYEADLKALYDSLKAKKISITKYEEEKATIQAKYNRQEISNGIAQAEALIGNLKSIGFDTTDLEKQLNAQRQALRDADVQSLVTAEQKKIKKLEETAQAIQQFQTLSNNIFQAYGEIASISLDRQKVGIDELEAKQQKNYENEIKRINASAATDAEKADQLKILEAKRIAQKEENERRARQLEIQRAKFEKAANIASIITATALAVVNTLKDPALIATKTNVAQAIVVGLLGAAQLARAIAVPLPKYEKGTQSAKQGWAVTDEKGPELFIEPGGKTFMGSDEGPVTRYLKAGTRIIPADEVNQTLNNAMIRQTAMALQGSSFKSESEHALNRIEQAILQSADASIREMRRKSKGNSTTNIIDIGWVYKMKQKTFN